MTPAAAAAEPHIPVLIRPLIAAVQPVHGHWVDGTFGAGGYTRALLAAGADRVTAIDRDPSVFPLAEAWAGEFGDRLDLVEGRFSDLDLHAASMADGVVLDLGVSSMQIDQPERGFSFQKDGPLDMRMEGQGRTAADIVNTMDEARLADLLYLYGEEHAARRIARAIVAARPLTTTLQLAEVVKSVLPRQKPGQSHPATRSFQAIRIAVNDEYTELVRGLMAAERVLRPGGLLAVVTFHSVEDRITKRFMADRAGQKGQGSRHAPILAAEAPTFDIVLRKAGADDQELAENPRARSARLRVARRTAAPSRDVDAIALGMPILKGDRR